MKRFSWSWSGIDETPDGDLVIYDDAQAEIERLREELEHSKWQTLRTLKENERLRAALRSIANNTCCDTCQEAARVARNALREEE